MTIRDRTIITGGGTLGQQIVRSLRDHRANKNVTVYDQSEDALWKCAEIDPEVTTVLGNIRDMERLDPYLRDCTLFVNTAAIKHVGFAERFTGECIRTNIDALNTMLCRAVWHGVDRFVQISTDKVCHPENVYGVSKLMGEHLVRSAHASMFHAHCWRFGNFLGSQGSFLDKWKQQRRNGKIKLTDPDMNRFFITPFEAAENVVTARDLSGYDSGCIFIPQMKVFNMGIIADIIADRWSVEIEVIGPGLGEKLNEHIVTEQEAPYTSIMYGKGYCIWPVLPESEDALDCALTTEVLPTMTRDATEKYLEGFI